MWNSTRLDKKISHSITQLSQHLLTLVNLLKITSKECGIAKLHGVHSNTVANRACEWKALLCDKDFT